MEEKHIKRGMFLVPCGSEVLAKKDGKMSAAMVLDHQQVDNEYREYLVEFSDYSIRKWVLLKQFLGTVK